MIIIEEKRKVDFHSTQLYINKKEDVDALNEDFVSLGLTNKSDYLRNLIMLGLETKKNQERNVSMKESESLIKLDELSKKIDEIKDMFSNDDCNELVTELFDELKQTLKDEFMTTRGVVARLSKKIDSLTVHYDKVLGSIYHMVYPRKLFDKISKDDLDKGLFDELPDRLRGGDSNK